ncbi:hypothetical protein HNQ91_005933 [Filimonas zeae]|uniref:Uncharacterized protein n=1 Tax=Filimonas zeae TaxID=1737353 RepID=A0A917J3W3_9BACT|nr:hypothetical protein [Filimonas zeae]MDR6342846.1 hypothetical protein [Filimonas zeae]GGH82930.1 hypothetical protein GCM10011379_57560 [Filimonas zeae]
MDRLTLRNTFFPLIVVFVLVNILCLSFQPQLQQRNIDPLVIQGGNGLLFVLAVISAVMHFRALKTANPHAFVRSIMGTTVLKLFSIAGAAFIYIYMAGKARNKYALLICMALYIVYSIIEVAGAFRLNKEKHGSR